MGELTPFITAFTSAIAILSTLWIFRRTRRVDTIHFLFALLVMVYTGYHFYACGILGIINPTHGLITGLFISVAAIANAYCSTCVGDDSQVRIGVCRRTDQNTPVRTDRRKILSDKIFKDTLQ